LLDLLPIDEFRLFCGDLGIEVNDGVLANAFSKYSSFNMSRVSLTFRNAKGTELLVETKPGPWLGSTHGSIVLIFYSF